MLLRQLGEGPALIVASHVVPKMWGFSQLPDTFSRTLNFAEDDRDTSCMTKVFRNESANGGRGFGKTKDSSSRALDSRIFNITPNISNPNS